MRFPVALPVPVTMLEEFKENLQLALSWMEEVQRQLKANDCTEGPRDRLEARLRDTKVRVREEPLSDWIKQNENITGLSCRGRQGAAPYFSLSMDTQYSNPLSCPSYSSVCKPSGQIFFHRMVKALTRSILLARTRC